MNASTRIIAHRGNSSEAPENTLAAFRLAVEAGAHGVELDVQASSDGVPVVIHDERLERTTDGGGAVADHPASALTALNAGAWFDPPYPNERLPTLAEVLEVLGPSGLEIHLELKPARNPTPGWVAAVVRMAAEAGLEERVHLSSFDHRALLEARAAGSRFPLAALVGQRLIDPWDYAVRHRFQAVHPEFTLVDETLVERCHEHNLAVRVYTVDEEDDAVRLMGWGVDGIFTNVPRQMLALRESLFGPG